MSAAINGAGRADSKVTDLRTGSIYVLGLLLAVNVVNYVDRSLIGTLAQPIKQDLRLSDTQLSLLTGVAFVLLYLVSGPFLARWIDRGYRRALLIGGLVVWSLATLATAYAQSFAMLAISRVALGVGEATAFPAAMSMIGDLFAPAQRPKAVAVYQSGGTLAVMAGTALAGVLGEDLGWRSVFLLCGVVGLALSAILTIGLRDPARGGFDDLPQEAGAGGQGFVPTVRLLLRIPGFGWAVLSLGLLAMSGAILSSWAPAFLLRVHAAGLAVVGTVLGPAVGLGGVAGAVIFGALASELARRSGSPRATLLPPLLALPLAIPCLCVFLLAPSFPVAVGSVALANFLLASGSGPVVALVVSLAPPRLRGTAATVLLFSQALIGLCLGPLLVGAASDVLAPSLGAESVRYAMGVVVVSPLSAMAALLVCRRRL